MFDENSPSLFDNVRQDYRPGTDERPLSDTEQAHVPALPPQSGIRGMGRSPDGLGQRLPVHVPTGQTGLAYTGPWEPKDVSPEGAVRSAGVTTLLVAVSFGAGAALGGWAGGLAGLMLSGAAFNGYRAQKWWGSADPGEKHEAVTSAIMATVGLMGGGYAAYKAWEQKKGG
jgi:hypothetical protein